MSADTAYPVALERDILAGSLVRARLLDLSLVIWRADDGEIRVWEDRCPHRSVRLSAGRNLSDCVEGVYHGWRFGKDGTVVAVPADGNAAHPDIRVKVLATAVAGGLVWASTGENARPPASFKLAKGEVPIRPLPFWVDAARVTEWLFRLDGVRAVATPTGAASCVVFGHVAPKPREDSIDAVRRVNRSLNALRRRAEAEAAR